MGTGEKQGRRTGFALFHLASDRFGGRLRRFQLRTGQSEYYRLTAPISADDVSGWEDAWRACYGDIPRFVRSGLNGAEWPDRSYCCDYFFVSADLVDQVESGGGGSTTAASDHQPIRL